MISLAMQDDYMLSASLHQQYIGNSFLSSLGKPFLTKMYYLLQKKGLLIVAKERAVVIGFVSFSINVKSLFIAFLLKEPFFLFLTVIKLMGRPLFLKKMLETLIMPFKKNNHDGLPSTELLSIVVDGKYQSKGIAQSLLFYLEEELCRREIQEYKVVAGSNLAQANKFYKKNGFKLERQTIIHDNLSSNIYIKSIHNVK